MSSAADETAAAAAAAVAVPQQVSIGAIFREFLMIGAISFGGVVPYLRGRLVVERRWLDDRDFVEMLSMSQSLPGLNATNMAVLLGDRLRGGLGSLVAIIGICLPGAVLLFAVGLVYREHAEVLWFAAALKGVAAAAVGLILYTVIQLSEKSIDRHMDLVFVAITVIAVNHFHLSVLWALLGVGALAILWHRPRKPVPAANRIPAPPAP
jgi:chromate transporter